MLIMVLLESMILVIALVVLAKSSSVAVEKAADISRLAKVSQLAIGFLLVSVLTSLPELSVSVIASLSGASAIAVGNVFGSVVANLLLVFGLGALVYGLMIGDRDYKELRFGILLTIAIVLFILFNGFMTSWHFGFIQGIILLGIFVFYSMYVFMGEKIDEPIGEKIGKGKALKTIVVFVVAMGLVLLSADFVVRSASAIAEQLKLVESIIGATLVAVGTSVPEISISLQAIKQKKYEIAIGTVIGSNVVDLSLVLGTASIIKPLAVSIPFVLTITGIMIVANIVVLYLFSLKRMLRKGVGIVLLGMYVAYILLLIPL